MVERSEWLDAASFRRPGVEALPAGIYYRRHTYQPCRHLDVAEDDAICITPTHLVVAGVHADAAGAEAMARRADALDLPPGYPFVAHSGELGIRGDAEGIAVVVGQLASQEDAEQWREALAGWLPAEVLALLPSEQAFERLHEGSPPVLSARITGSTEVPAHAGTIVDDGDGRPSRWPPDEAGDEPLRVQCSLAPGTVVTANGEEFARHVYSWIAVRCPDGSDAWVRWKDTTLGVTIRRAGDHFEAIRLVGAECDRPIFEHGPLAGESMALPGVAARVRSSGGCGG